LLELFFTNAARYFSAVARKQLRSQFAACASPADKNKTPAVARGAKDADGRMDTPEDQLCSFVMPFSQKSSRDRCENALLEVITATIGQ
jgi:hypothetical protein